MRFSILLAALSALADMSVRAESLADYALGKVLADASPIFGEYVKTSGSRANWMASYPDDTPIVHLNIPGTHDSATWNYSQETQDKLLSLTTNVNLVDVQVPEALRCQNVSFIDQLDQGIRAFDLRYAYDPTNTTLVFYHGPALQSQTATLDSVLFGFYQWIEDHPSETLFLSFQHESSTAKYTSNNADQQLALYDALTSPAARRYFLQTKDELGRLGCARGKIHLFRRFDLDKLPAAYTAALPGLHFSPSNWTDNSKDIALVYNTERNATAYIEDYYTPFADVPPSAPATVTIAAKFNATAAHLLRAASAAAPDSLFWTFASSTNNGNSPADYPVIQALGNGTALTPLGGVNQQLVPVLQQLRGKRVGIVMFDYFSAPTELLDEFFAL